MHKSVVGAGQKRERKGEKMNHNSETFNLPCLGLAQIRAIGLQPVKYIKCPDLVFRRQMMSTWQAHSPLEKTRQTES